MCNQLYLLNFQVIKFISTNISTKKLTNQYKKQFATQSNSLYLLLKGWLQKAISALIPANAFFDNHNFLPSTDLTWGNNASLKDQTHTHTHTHTHVYIYIHVFFYLTIKSYLNFTTTFYWPSFIRGLVHYN